MGRPRARRLTSLLASMVSPVLGSCLWRVLSGPVHGHGYLARTIATSTARSAVTSCVTRNGNLANLAQGASDGNDLRGRGRLQWPRSYATKKGDGGGRKKGQKTTIDDLLDELDDDDDDEVEEAGRRPDVTEGGVETPIAKFVKECQLQSKGKKGKKEAKGIERTVILERRLVNVILTQVAAKRERPRAILRP
jgi:hypothetical protein